MEYPAPKVRIDDEYFELLSMQQFKSRVKLPKLSTATLNYKIENDLLDFVKIGRFRYIIYNHKAQGMKVLNRRPNKQQV